MAEPMNQTTAVLEFTFPELQFLSYLIDYKRQEPHWAPSYLAMLNAIGPRIEAVVARIETPYKEAEILRQADEIQERRRQEGRP